MSPPLAWPRRGRSAARNVEKPNIVLMLCDNIGYGDLGCYGNRLVQTPCIDRLAAEGVRCTDFYIASPSCMPSRGVLSTGRHPLRRGYRQIRRSFRCAAWLGEATQSRVRTMDSGGGIRRMDSASYRWHGLRPSGPEGGWEAEGRSGGLGGVRSALRGPFRAFVRKKKPDR
ncbi:MAG: sulfatase-like hydrolase/transferase [Phycisphaerales bacterium]|nr:MAG: sulfatase-like hydrolase/transferase [Phycisphaerales bacterium]